MSEDNKTSTNQNDSGAEDNALAIPEPVINGASWMIAVVLGVWLIYFGIALYAGARKGGDLSGEALGQFGDAFGFVNALISTVCLVFIVVQMIMTRQQIQQAQKGLKLTEDQVKLQIAEMRQSTEELANQREELALQRATMEAHNQMIEQQSVVNNIHAMLERLDAVKAGIKLTREDDLSENASVIGYVHLDGLSASQIVGRCIQKISIGNTCRFTGAATEIFNKYLFNYASLAAQLLLYIKGAQMNDSDKRQWIHNVLRSLGQDGYQILAFYMLAGNQEVKNIRSDLMQVGAFGEPLGSCLPEPLVNGLLATGALTRFSQ